MGSVSVEGLRKELDSRTDLLSARDRFGKMLYTTQEALKEEETLKNTTRAGRGRYAAINPDYQIKNDMLSDEQSKAVHHVLNSRSFITIVTGGAGTGKTWSIKEVAEGVKDAGMGFHAFAPSADASRGCTKRRGL